MPLSIKNYSYRVFYSGILHDVKCDLLKPGSYSAQHQAECVKRGGNSAALTFSSSCIEGGEKRRDMDVCEKEGGGEGKKGSYNRN